MSVQDKILHLENLTVSFDGFKALNELTLHVEPGELRCIIGQRPPSAAGPIADLTDQFVRVHLSV